MSFPSCPFVPFSVLVFFKKANKESELSRVENRSEWGMFESTLVCPLFWEYWHHTKKKRGLQREPSKKKWEVKQRNGKRVSIIQEEGNKWMMFDWTYNWKREINVTTSVEAQWTYGSPWGPWKKRQVSYVLTWSVAHWPCQASLCYPYYLRSVHSVPYSRVPHHDRKEPRANTDDSERCLRSGIASPCCASKTWLHEFRS